MASFIESIVADSQVTAAAGPIRLAPTSTADPAPSSEELALELEATDEVRSEILEAVHLSLPETGRPGEEDDPDIDGPSDVSTSGSLPQEGNPATTLQDRLPPPPLPHRNDGLGARPAATVSAPGAVDESPLSADDRAAGTPRAAERTIPVLPLTETTPERSLGNQPRGDHTKNVGAGSTDPARSLADKAIGNEIGTNGTDQGIDDPSAEHGHVPTSLRPSAVKPVPRRKPETDTKSKPVESVNTDASEPAVPRFEEPSIDPPDQAALPEVTPRSRAAVPATAPDDPSGEPASGVYIGKVDIYLEAQPAPPRQRETQARQPRSIASAAYLRRL